MWRRGTAISKSDPSVKLEAWFWVGDNFAESTWVDWSVDGVTYVDALSTTKWDFTIKSSGRHIA